MAATTTDPRARPAPPARRPRPPSHPATVVVLLLVAGLTAWHASEASEHLLTDRDPGVYVTTGRWLAREGTLLVDPAVGPFRDHPGLGFEEQGWNLDDDGRLEPQFLHLLPVVLAGAHVVGGDGLLLAAPAIVAGLALLAVFAFARRVVGPWWAVAATLALGVDLVWVHLSRDAYSEPLAVLLLFAGLTVLWDATGTRRPLHAFGAGLLLGAVSMARVEGFVALLPLAAHVAAVLVRAQRAPAAERRRTVRCTAALVAGVALTTAVAVADLLLYGTWYLDDLGGLLLAVAAGLALVVAGGAAAVAVAAARRRTEGPRPSHRARSFPARLAAGAVVVAAAAAWWVRPAVSTVTGQPAAAIAELELREGLPAEGVRRYSELSFQWLAWYVGPVALALGVAGLALVVHRLVASPRRDPDRRLLPFVGVLATISVLYLWRPSIVPDHIWVMRRYAVVTLPGLAVLAALAASCAVRRLSAWRPGVAAATAGVAVAALVTVPVATLLPVASTTTQRGMLAAVRDVCDAVGPDGAVVVVPGSALELVTAQSIRSFCGVPAAIADAGLGRDGLGSLGQAWAAEGRALHLLGAAPADVEALAGQPPELVVDVANDEQLEARLTGRPDRFRAIPVRLVVAEVAPAPAVA